VEDISECDYSTLGLISECDYSTLGLISECDYSTLGFINEARIAEKVRGVHNCTNEQWRR